MNNFEMKLKYHSEKIKNGIDSPFNIRKVIEESEKSKMKEKSKIRLAFRNTAYGICAAAAVFVLTFNCFPSLAYAASDVPVLCDVVRVVTFNRFEINGENFSVDVATPKIEGLINKELEDELNSNFSKHSEILIRAFEEDIKELSEEYSDNSFYLGLNAGYSLRTDNDDILALDFFIEHNSASAVATHRFYNIDKKSGNLITLESLFKPNSDYVTVLSKYILSLMNAENANGNGFYFTDNNDPQRFERISNDQNFFINDDGNLVICFDEYEVAAGAQGCPEFEIPREVIKDILK